MSDDLLSQMTPVIVEEPLAVGHDEEPRKATAAAEPRRNAFGVPVDMAADEPDLDDDKPFDAPYGDAEPMRHAPAGTSTGDNTKHEVMVVGGTAELRHNIVEVLKTIYDPEIPVNIYELGLVYNIVVADDATVAIRMTLTSPACPVAGSLPPEVEQKVMTVEGVTSAKVDIVWEPPWSPDKMSDEAKLQLNLPY
jgi:FeS assembly SUF system protein